jgi:hypothetical protein
MSNINIFNNNNISDNNLSMLNTVKNSILYYTNIIIVVLHFISFPQIFGCHHLKIFNGWFYIVIKETHYLFVI